MILCGAVNRRAAGCLAVQALSSGAGRGKVGRTARAGPFVAGSPSGCYCVGRPPERSAPTTSRLSGYRDRQADQVNSSGFKIRRNCLPL